jgi:mannose-1-phosphate guanylyltransferase
MAGGRGERFWPKSRKSMPKQLLDVFTGTPLIQETVTRLKGLIPIDNIYVITNQMIASKIKDFAPELNEKNIIAEPMGRNTAAAIGVMATYLKVKFGNPTILIATADHVIPDYDLFLKHVSVAAEIADKNNALITFGIKPSYPETGFGYIKSGKIAKTIDGIKTFHIDRFEEKPDIDTAIQYMENGTFYWNSGIFCWKCDTILDALRIHMPDLYEKLMDIESGIIKGFWPSILDKIYPELKSIPIDKGIMEKAQNALVVESNFGWHDIGSWVTLEAIRPKDANENVLMGPGISVDSQNNIIVSEKPFVAALGVKDMIIVALEDTILICPKNKAQEIRKVIQEIEKKPELHKFL